MANYQFYLDYIQHVEDETRKGIDDKEKALKESFKKQLAELKQHHIDELDNLKRKHEEELAAVRNQANIDKVALTEELVGKYSEEIHALETSIKEWQNKCVAMVPMADHEKLQSQYNNLEEKLKEGKAKARSNKNQLVKDYEGRINDLENELKQLKDDYALGVSKSEFQALKRLNEENQKQLEIKMMEFSSLKRDNDNLHRNIEIIENEHQDIENKLRRELATRQEQHEKELASLRSQLNKEISENDYIYSSQFDDFKAKVKERVKEKDDEIAKLKKEIEEKEETIYEMKHRGFLKKLKELFTN